MKLLIYSHFFAPSVGGVETVVRSLAAGLASLKTAAGAKEFEVTVVTQTSRGEFSDETLGFAVIREPGMFRLAKLIRDSDLMHLAGPALGPLVLAKILRKPVVLEHHGFQVLCPNGQLLIERHGTPCPGHFMAGHHVQCLKCNSGRGWLTSLRLWVLTFMRRLLASRVQANVTPTQWLGGLLELPAVAHVPHGLEPRPDYGVQRSASREPFRIVFQGRLVSTKGVETLLEAARLLGKETFSFELVIIGNGPDRGRLESMAAGPPLAGKVRFAGRLGASELEGEILRADVVVVPSLGGEVFGLVVAENMQRGLPVVASDIGAFVEVLGNSGVTFRTGDAADLARTLKGILEDPSRRVELGGSARRRAQDAFGLSEMIEGHAALYRQLAD